MTPLARRLGERQIPSAEIEGDQATPLSGFRPRQRVRVTGLAKDLSADHCRRLYDLGFAPGAQVDVVRRAPARDPWVYRVGGSEIALRSSLARGVLVVPA